MGSSIRRSGGSTARARAIATRCASPPESSRGFERARPATPSPSSSARARASASARERRSAWMGASVTLSSADRCSKRQWSWKTSPTLRRSSESAASRGSGPGWSGTPSTRIAPAWNGSRAATARSIVVLPQPERPMSATSSPRASERSTPFRTSVAPRERRRPLIDSTGALTPRARSTVPRAAARDARAAATSRDTAPRRARPGAPSFRCSSRRSPSAS